MKGLSLHFGIWLALSLLIGSAVAVGALILGGTLTGVMASQFPDFSYGLVERWVCPAGSSIQVDEGGRTTYYGPGTTPLPATIILVTCVNEQGEAVREGPDVTAKAFFGVFLAYVLGSFAIIFLPIAILLWFIAGKMAKGLATSSGSQAVAKS